MKNTFLSKTIFSQATPVLGAVALSAIALLGMPQSAKADDTCGPGAGWVNECKAGSDHFDNSWVNIHLWWNLPVLEAILGPLPQTFPMNDWLMFSGPVWVDRAAGNGNVIKTTLFHELKGKHDFFGNLTLTTTGTGEIKEMSNGLANSLFDVNFKLNAPGFQGFFGGSTKIYADRFLTGVSPDNPAVPPGPSTGVICPSSPEEVLIYCNHSPDPTNVWAFDLDGNPILDDYGNPIIIAQIHSEEHIIHPRVPEPSTAAASIFVGVAAMFGLKRKQQSNK